MRQFVEKEPLRTSFVKQKELESVDLSALQQCLISDFFLLLLFGSAQLFKLFQTNNFNALIT